MTMTDKEQTLFLLACAEGHLLDIEKRIADKYYGEGDEEEWVEDKGRLKEIQEQIEGLEQKLEALKENAVWTPGEFPIPCTLDQFSNMVAMRDKRLQGVGWVIHIPLIEGVSMIYNNITDNLTFARYHAFDPEITKLDTNGCKWIKVSCNTIFNGYDNVYETYWFVTYGASR